MIPKFRVWDLEQSTMYDENDLFSITFYQEEIYVEVDAGPFEDNYEVLSFELMQSTGLKDINGKEIYIGDLVKCDLNINDTIDKRVYEIVNNGFELILKHVFTEWQLSECIDSVEVIGNIYQHPNLLEADSHE